MQILVVKAGNVNTLQAGHALDLEELVDEAPALLGVLCGAFWCVAGACCFLLAIWGPAALATQLGDSCMSLWDQQAAPKCLLVCWAWFACCCWCGRAATCGSAEHDC